VAPTVRPARRRRWHRLAIPLGVVGLFWVVTFAAHIHQRPDFTDGGTLSPTGTGRHGSSQLAQRLEAEGISVVRVTSTDEALEAAVGQDATIFVPAPDLLDGRLLGGLVAQAGLHRLVLVRPGLLGRLFSGVPYEVSERWATTTVAPGCDKPYAIAGPAGVGRDTYVGDGADCYGGSVAEYRVIDVRVTVVGATDPFRNDRFAETGNAALATALLSAHKQVIWLDVHRSELRVSLPPIQIPDYGRGDRDRTNTGDPLFDAFPELLWVGAALVLAAALLFAVARARRLGPPVPEPLPVLVPAAEAVLGRGRLYRRIRARQASLATLRTAAISRLARVLDPMTPWPERGLTSSGPSRDAFVRVVAARAGIDDAAVSAILFGEAPDDDAGLVQAAAQLDQLVAAVASGTQPNQSGGSQ
jgi:hypothetical protein